MVTAELAACLPVLMILLAAASTAVLLAGERVRAADAAREAARAAARDDVAVGAQLAAAAAPGGSLTISRSGDRVEARVRVVVHPIGGWLPGMTVVERAVAAREPAADGGAPP
jgi:hypothetical protein